MSSSSALRGNSDDRQQDAQGASIAPHRPLLLPSSASQVDLSSHHHKDFEGQHNSRPLPNSQSLSLFSSNTGKATRSRNRPRPSPYARTPTKPRGSDLGTPSRLTQSPSMLSGLLNLISPFGGSARAKRSAAFGNPLTLDDQGEDDQNDSDEIEGLTSPSQRKIDRDVIMGNGSSATDIEIDVQEDVTKGVNSAIEITTTTATTSTTKPSPFQPPSPRSSRISFPVTPSGSHGTEAKAKGREAQKRLRATETVDGAGESIVMLQQPGPSPVSRNYDLLARFFAEKGLEEAGVPGRGALTEVEVQGCLKLIEDSMAQGRDLRHEFESHGQRYEQGMNRSVSYSPAPSSPYRGYPPRTSSYGPSAGSGLFHPGSAPKIPQSFSFLSPLASRGGSSQSNASTPATVRRHRPLYLGPGMTSLQPSRRRLLTASRTSVDLQQRNRSSGLTSSVSMGTMRDVRPVQKEDGISDDAKRRKTEENVHDTSTASLSSPSAEIAGFDSQYEKHRAEAIETVMAISSTPIPPSSVSEAAPSLKRSALSSGSLQDSETTHHAIRPAPESAPEPVRRSTRTAAAVLDILKDSPAIRPPVQPELVNPYQKATALSKIPRKPKTPVTTRITRSKAKESAANTTPSSQPAEAPRKESVLELIERTAPKRGKSESSSDAKAAAAKERDAEVKEAERQAKAAAAAAAAARKAQQTEEARKRLEALTQPKAPEKASAAPSEPTFSFGSQKPQAEPAKTQSSATSSPSIPAFTFGQQKPSASLAPQVPAQYAANKPKKPSPLSAAFAAPPDSPGSDSEKSPAKTITTAGGGNGATTTPAPAPPRFSFAPPATDAPTSPSAAATSEKTFTFGLPPVSAPTTTARAAPSGSNEKPAPTTFQFTLVGSSAAPPAPLLSTSDPRKDALSVLVDRLPTYSFGLYTSSAGGGAGESKEVEAVRNEVLKIAEQSLPKFDFIVTADGSKKSAALTAQPVSAPFAAPTFSFGAATGTPTPASPAPSSGFSTPSFSLGGSEAQSPAPATPSAAATTDGSEPSPEEDAGGSSSGLLSGKGEGEEDEEVLHEVRAKLWKFDGEQKTWKDLGIGMVKIKKHSETGKKRLLVRSEGNGKVVVNFYLFKGLAPALEKTTVAFLGFEGSTPTQIRCKIKTEDDAKRFKESLEREAKSG
ncbi:hypothetical protein IE53DRAFT_31819 [Violaceomyces palustris]|uniref:Uncharacterized protein n=1 Tax=Violaceomyces palustris TaxID=1673888 RepID=A0ACD0P1B1_9BASI|nr:hypothetical protein IE53DRAFT_31819 [Violaceomyces palustris]